jgi:hypothetical protein
MLIKMGGLARLLPPAPEFTRPDAMAASAWGKLRRSDGIRFARRRALPDVREPKNRPERWLIRLSARSSIRGRWALPIRNSRNQRSRVCHPHLEPLPIEQERGHAEGSNIKSLPEFDPLPDELSCLLQDGRRRLDRRNMPAGQRHCLMFHSRRSLTFHSNAST